jgi:hypothetical protein
MIVVVQFNCLNSELFTTINAKIDDSKMHIPLKICANNSNNINVIPIWVILKYPLEEVISQQELITKSQVQSGRI